jgi:hypothetical protein
VTRATSKAVRRVVITPRGEELVAEVRDGTLTLRPKGSWVNGSSQVSVNWGKLYVMLMQESVPPRRRRVRRGLLSL